LTLHVAYVVIYQPPDGCGEPELQGAGSERLEAGQIAVRCAENILGTAVWDEQNQAWIGEGGGVVVVRPVEFEWPKGEPDEEEAPEA